MEWGYNYGKKNKNKEKEKETCKENYLYGVLIMAYKTKNRTAGKSVKAKKKKPIPAKKDVMF